MFEKNRPLCERDGGPEILILYLNIYSTHAATAASAGRDATREHRALTA
jgi:hypothetical protein